MEDYFGDGADNDYSSDDLNKYGFFLMPIVAARARLIRRRTTRENSGR
jgi:hypothetical protein